MSNKHDLYYLFPGQGQGRRKRHLKELILAVGVGLASAGILAGVLYYLDL